MILTAAFKSVRFFASRRPSMDFFKDCCAKDPSGIYRSVNDLKLYKKITLKNGFQAVLVSDPTTNELISEADSGKRVQEKRRRRRSNAVLTPSPSPSPSPSASDTSDGEVSEEGSTSDSDVDGSVDGLTDGSKKKKLSAACLRVNVGSFQDPSELPGLAHLLEHVVFMGSKKFPEENALDVFLSGHGGFSNARTDYERTMYEFEVPNQYFFKALDIFANTFICPLLKPGSVEKEIRPVDTEFSDSCGDDSTRLEQFFTTLTKSSHPLAKFSWGNALTLSKPNAHEELIKMFNKYYVAKNMVLIVQAQESLESLEKCVTELFSQAKTGNVPKSVEPKPSPDFEFSKSPYEQDKFNKLYVIKPLEKVNKLLLSWWLPSLDHHYKTMPIHHISSLVGHEAKGSLLSFLKQKNLALELEAGNDGENFDCNQYQTMFSIVLDLTDEGVKQIEKVVKYVFAYMDMFQSNGPQKWYYEEDSLISATSFRFQDESSAHSTTKKLAKNFLSVPYEDLLIKDLPLMYDHSIIEKCLSYLTRDRACFIVSSTNIYDHVQESERTEKWMETKYKECSIPPAWLEKLSFDAFGGEVYFPIANEFIATDFTIKPNSTSNSKYPLVIAKGKNHQLWYKKDNIFKKPKACLNFSFSSKVIEKDIRKMISMDLFIELLDHFLKDHVYYPYVAELSYTIGMYDKSFVINVRGFNHKLNKLIDLIVKQIVDFKIDEQVFETVKSNLSKGYFNAFLPGINLQKSLRLKILEENYFTSVDKRKLLPGVSADDVLLTVREFFSNSYADCLFQGNITEDEATNTLHEVLSRLCPTGKETSRPIILIREIPKGERFLRVSSFNEEEKTSVITNYYQIGPGDTLTMCLLELLNYSMEEPLFNTLRTEEGLGYDVSCQNLDTYGIGGFRVCVTYQTQKFNPHFINLRMENFLNTFAQLVQKMSSDTFNKLVESRIKIKSAPDLKLTQEVDRNWEEVLTLGYCFNRSELEIQTLQKITLQQFRNWAIHHVLNFPSRKKLSIQALAVKHSRTTSNEQQILDNVYSLNYQVAQGEEAEGSEFIYDIDKFTQGLKVYPPSLPFKLA